MMVELLEPKADEVICDPACGTSDFLVVASEYLKEHRKEEVPASCQTEQSFLWRKRRAPVRGMIFRSICL
ncbi:MAG: N-6 DNA methylase [Hungatella sp.]|nr:N-6 DNA methylase [Hungatella sp.]